MEPENHPNLKRKIIFRNPFLGFHDECSVFFLFFRGVSSTRLHDARSPKWLARKEISGFVTAGSNPFTEKTEDSSSPPSGGNFWDA